MGDVVDLAEHRENPGTVWFSGILKCVYCAREHVGVMAMPSWALAPMTSECTGCGKIGAIPVVDGFKDDPSRNTPWYDTMKGKRPPKDVIAGAVPLLDEIDG